jgi:NAD(P)-dependent dehydrogenase (short-subunit alcohol dehydrogenase family)
MKILRGRVAVVTGAASGIGRALAARFASEGRKVMLADVEDFWGVLHGCSAFLPLLREQGEGHLVNVASHAALTGYFPAGTPYVASKFAVLGLSENLYHELKAADEPIGVSVLCPSFVRTSLPFSERNRPRGVPSTDARTRTSQSRPCGRGWAGLAMAYHRNSELRDLIVLAAYKMGRAGQVVGWERAW